MEVIWSGINERNVDLIPDTNHSASASLQLQLSQKRLLSGSGWMQPAVPSAGANSLGGGTWLRSTNKESLVGGDANPS